MMIAKDRCMTYGILFALSANRYNKTGKQTAFELSNRTICLITADVLAKSQMHPGLNSCCMIPLPTRIGMNYLIALSTINSRCSIQTQTAWQRLATAYPFVGIGIFLIFPKAAGIGSFS